MKNKKRLTALAVAGVLAGSSLISTTGPAVYAATKTSSAASKKKSSSSSNKNETTTSSSTSNSNTSSDTSSSSNSNQQGGPGGNGGTPPEKPGDNSNSSNGSSSNNNGGTPPSKPDGDSNSSGSNGGPGGNGGTPPEMPGNGSGGPGGGADTQTFDYSGSYSGAKAADGAEVSSDSETIAATDKDQNAALAENGGTLKITKGTLTKSGDDEDGDNCNFYGLNSIFLAVGESSKGYISDSKLSADSQGSNGIFATDSAKVYANNDEISTTKDNSRGLDATYGGTILANKMTIKTKGNHSAALATDRGGGNVSVTNSTLSTDGSGSPLLYSTGDIEVDNVTGTATKSQIAGMEGLNTILIHNSKLTSTNTGTTGSDPVANGVIIYQSTSGDAETTTGETAKFQAVDSTLKSAITSGSMFYVTNTTANILLSNTTLDFDSSKANLLQIEGNDSNNWGTAGSNGGTVTFTAKKETLKGNISVDTISSLDFYLLSGSTYTGKMSITENFVNTSASESPITVNISKDSKWVLTGDTTISNLNAEDGAKIVDEDGKTVTIVVNGTTKVKGDSDITLTVTGSYSTTVTTGDSNKIDEDYIDRSDFDSYYGTSTTFGTNGGNASTTSAKSSGKGSDTTSESFPIAQTAGGVVLLVLAAGVATVVIKKHKKNKEESERPSEVQSENEQPADKDSETPKETEKAEETEDQTESAEETAVTKDSKHA